MSHDESELDRRKEHERDPQHCELQGELSGLSLGDALLWMIGAYVLLQAGLHAIVGQPGPPLLWAGGIQIMTLGACSYALVKQGSQEGSHGATLGFRVFSIRGALAGGLLGAAVKLPAEYLRYAVELVWPTPESLRQAQAALLSHDSVAQVLSLFVVVALSGPIMEELFYRGALFGGLQSRLGALQAGAITALGFVVTHAIWDWIPLMLVALVLTALRIFTRSLWPPLVAHVSFNALSCVMIVQEMPAVDPRSGVGALGASLLAFSLGISGVGMWLLVRSGNAGRSRAGE